MDHDVVIVGAGPVGLFLACELRLAGASVLVVERENDPRSPLKRLPFGLRGLSIPTVEGFDRRGLLQDIAAPLQPSGRSGGGGHFAGIALDHNNIDSTNWTYRLQGPADAPLAATMEHIETVLTARACAMGVEINRGLGIDRVDQTSGHVTVHAGDRSIEASWLVGCDGGRSVVRKAADFEFVGTEPTFTGYSVQVELADHDTLPLGRHYTPAGMYVQPQPGTIALADFDGGAFHRSGPITREHVQEVLRRVSGTDVSVTKLALATSWTDRAQQATAYRRGRILLAGDAAHIHSPLGGQGLNLGLGDAMNLGWKLGAVVAGVASIELVDTYCAERHPVGAAVLDWSRAQVALMEPRAGARALADVVADLIGTRDGATYVAERSWGISLRYHLGDGHPLTGRSAPDFELCDGTRLGVVLRDGMAVLLDFDRDAGLRSASESFGADLRYLEGDVRERLGLSAVLVRPDGVVAWACDRAPVADEVVNVLSQWLRPLR